MSEIRPSFLGKFMALDEDKTTTDAVCIALIQTTTFNNKRTFRVGYPTTPCPKCGVLSIVVTDENQVSNHEKAQAVHGSIVKFRCPFGSNLVIGILPSDNCNVVVI